MIRNILICTTQVPFTTGGAESHVEGLRRALIAAGYKAEVVALPFKWSADRDYAQRDGLAHARSE